MTVKSFLKAAMAACVAGLLTGCISGNFKLFTDATDPLKEQRLDGYAYGKLLVIPVTGVITASPDGSFLRSKPSLVQDVVSQLALAERDPEIKSVLLVVNSPGGTITASDILYTEILGYKQRTGAKVVVSMMDVAASGGYYISLPADCIYAHPTTITGSVGVIFMRPEFYGLMDKLGLAVKSDTSGKHKDMGSPFRKATDEEDALFKKLVSDLAVKFMERVKARRPGISEEALKDVSTARIYLADEALALGLIDKTGYMDDAVAEARRLAGLSPDSKIVVYRRDKFPNDNIYNMSSESSAGTRPLIDTGVIGQAATMQAGFYYLWPATLP